MIIYTTRNKEEALSTLRQAIDSRVRAWGKSTEYVGIEIQVRLKKGNISEEFCTVKITCNDLWFITGYAPYEGYCAWFTKSGNFRLTPKPPKHWKGNR